MRKSIFLLEIWINFDIFYILPEKFSVLFDSPRVTIPPEPFDVQTKHAGQPANPKTLSRSLLFFAGAAVIKFRLGEFLYRHEARETVGEVAGRQLFLVDVFNALVIFFGNVQRKIEKFVVLFAFCAAHQAANFTEQSPLKHVRDKRGSFLDRRWADVIFHFAIGRRRWQRIRHVLKFRMQPIEHIPEKFVSIMLVVAFEGRNHFPHHEKETLG